MPQQLYADTERARSGVTAHERDIVLASKRAEPARKPFEPNGIGLRERQREQRPRGLRTHRREIAEIDRERPMADRLGRKVREEVITEDHRVDGAQRVACPAGSRAARASSPMPSATSARRAPQSRKNRSISSNSPRAFEEALHRRAARAPPPAATQTHLSQERPLSALTSGSAPRPRRPLSRAPAAERAPLVLVRPKLACRAIENRIHELVRRRSRQSASQGYAFVDDNPKRHSPAATSIRTPQ